MIIIRSICLMFTDGKMVSTENEFIKNFGNATWLNLSSLTYVYIAVLIVISVILAYTNFGRRIYATGGNIEVARLAGIKVLRYKFAVFVIMGILCAIGGMMLVSELRAGSTQYGTDIALSCVAATVIGGTSLSGGSGNVIRTFLGMLVINVLYKALIFLGFQAYYQSLIKGVVLIAVVVLDAYVSQSSQARKVSA
jgi:ribose/xylose/arabinose/galactoside ABC-type transport system permease subunit